ncbi:Histone-lysine N-methyltransferase ATX1 [Acorus gramineus]|uniref:Histone-lysine N-methyltransferase ATX1 n=1 Tax=Acorus gramineus TaxID=55184 RepID=A0AAV9A2G8_ACOGR|nr:Histone-lysine N-methyltransferase ATX1 [Acorus gramineus]
MPLSLQTYIHGEVEEEEEVDGMAPKRYIPIDSLYCSTSPCVSASGSSMSKKIKARKMVVGGGSQEGEDEERPQEALPEKNRQPSIIHVYRRRRFHKNSAPQNSNELDIGSGLDSSRAAKPIKKRKISNLLGLGDILDIVLPIDETRLRSRREYNKSSGRPCKKQRMLPMGHGTSVSGKAKKWVKLSLEGVDPHKFVGLFCKVYWPIDRDWYNGTISKYNPETKEHHVKYEDGDEESLSLLNEKIEFHISNEEMQRWSLCEKKGLDENEMLALALYLDGGDVVHGDIVWAKLTGHAMWPALVMNESHVAEYGGLKPMKGTILVQFFGTHDFARIKKNQIVGFPEGLFSSFHLKCKQARFNDSLEEAEMYLKYGKFPERMLQMQRTTGLDYHDYIIRDEEEKALSSNNYFAEGSMLGMIEGTKIFPVEIKNLHDLPNSRLCLKYYENLRDLPSGYRAVSVGWKELDRCNVCYMDEEYEDNLFLQCDKCRMMVHAKCYGESEPLDGILWFCNLCRPGAPESPPPCCLCPIIGGAIKPTTDGRWAHLTCAIWIPETCLLDIKKMEPIDGLSRIHKDRWRLLCSICGVSYGACIQCSHRTCRVAYHPLCARAAGLSIELEDEDGIHLMSVDEDDADDQCIRLLSFCKKHKQPSNECSAVGYQIAQDVHNHSSYNHPINPSGCARSEPYNFFGRRGLREPQVLVAASIKRLFVENRPCVVSGYCQNGFLDKGPPFVDRGNANLPCIFPKLKAPRNEIHDSIVSMADKYKVMRQTFRKRLVFGKSAIHGFGVFAKCAHKAGDMVIEYTGELVRASIADIREHRIYNSLVGAGTYMFRIDDERVIDATRAGSIAHLINHSCKPNCYSRTISINGADHIIIYAKRDIKMWEELTYDYRFFSLEERLACYCGFPRCRGVVNDIEAEEQMGKIRMPHCNLIDWRGE